MRKLRLLLPATHLIVPLAALAVVLLLLAGPAALVGASSGFGQNGDLASAASRAPASLAGPAGTAAISGVVFFDANGDGALGMDETDRFEFAQVTLRTPGGIEVLPAVTTGIDGAYQFTGLNPGTYVVSETEAPGAVSSGPNSQTVTVEATAVTGIDFADTLPYTISGVIYNDLSGDGAQQPGEAGFGGVPVELYSDLDVDGIIDPADPLLMSTVTDGSGAYVLPNVLPGYRVLKIVPPVGNTSPSGNQTGLHLISNFGGIGVNEFWQNFPLQPVTQPSLACAYNTYIVANFNGTAIPAPRTIWFSARLKASGLPAGGTTIYFDNTEIQFAASGVAYHLAPGRGKVVFSPSATTTTTSYDASTQTWTTTVSPANWDKDVFLTGLGFAVPAAGLPGGINPVTWNGRLSAEKAGVTLEWKWAAAVYASLSIDDNANGVKAVSSNVENAYNNGDPAGAPENYKQYVVGGGRGGGGANYIGNDTPIRRGLCITPATPPYTVRVNCGSVSFTDSGQRVWAADRKYTVGAWGYMGGDAKSASGSIDGTGDDFLYLKYREKPVEYRFTVPNDTYNVTLKFAEFVANHPGERVMRITMEGAAVEAGLDILTLAGKHAALDKSYDVAVSDGLLNIVFDRSGSSSKDPVVSAIEVVPSSSGVTPTPPPSPTPTPTPTPSATPVPYSQTANAGSTTYTEGSGVVWSADKSYKTGSWGYTGGSAKSSKEEVTNTFEDGLYRTYRENPHEYRFTVPNGRYEVTLKFAEFTASNANDRLMKISLEGIVMEPSFSIWTAAGGKKIAFDRTYTVDVSDNLLNISFVKANGSNKEPIVSAIKVVSK